MPSFKYEGHLASGKAVSGSIEAANKEDAGQMLRQSGVFAREVSEGEVNLIYDHAPKPRGDIKVYDPEAVIDTPQKYDEARSKATKKPDEPKKEVSPKDDLTANFVRIMEVQKALKELTTLVRGSGKTKKDKESDRRRKVEKINDQIDQACTYALGLVIKEHI